MKTKLITAILLISFSGLQAQSVKDIDSNIYPTAKIGSKVWITQNLKTTILNDGTSIPLVTDSSTWSNCTSPSYCWYKNDKTSFKNPYGALYNFYTISTGKLCPTGWHVPTDNEWTSLTNYLGGSALAGGKLKEIKTVHWGLPNAKVTNESGFTALPGGMRGDDGKFTNLKSNGVWWTFTEQSPEIAVRRYLSYHNGDIYRDYCTKKAGFSVRCVKD
jgi:uncharacterized protein (TIGR02145 family)